MTQGLFEVHQNYRCCCLAIPHLSRLTGHVQSTMEEDSAGEVPNLSAPHLRRQTEIRKKIN